MPEWVKDCPKSCSLIAEALDAPCICSFHTLNGGTAKKVIWKEISA